MGMQVRTVLYASQDSTARRAASAAFHRIAVLEDILSSYRPSSELNRLVEQAENSAVPISDPLFTVLKRAIHLARHSGGGFDPTVGPYTNLWREARHTGQLPDTVALRKAATRVGWQNIHIDEDSQTVRLQADSMDLNLGGIAKGYILDQALDTLSEEGVSRALIEAGGDLVVSGPPPNREGWRVQLPGADSSGTTLTTTITHAAVSTSGDTEQSVEIDGTVYSHVVDPRTGLGLTHRLLVTVIADDGFTADGLATTIGVLGAEKGRDFLESYYPDARGYIRRAEPPSTH